MAALKTVSLRNPESSFLWRVDCVAPPNRSEAWMAERLAWCRKHLAPDATHPDGVLLPALPGRPALDMTRFYFLDRSGAEAFIREFGGELSERPAA